MSTPGVYLSLTIMKDGQMLYPLQDDLCKEIIRQLREDCEEARMALDDEGCSEHESWWCNGMWEGDGKGGGKYINKMDDDMKEFSRKFPDLVFEMRGDGDDDDWFQYFKDGKTQECHVIKTYDEYDESKLK